jgi:hypothetical protein
LSEKYKCRYPAKRDTEDDDDDDDDDDDNNNNNNNCIVYFQRVPCPAFLHVSLQAEHFE